jgi:short subunit dehydrogenase-like uncharacterized protein
VGDLGPIGLFGATGYTGLLVAEALVRAGKPWVAIGRNAAALEPFEDQTGCVGTRITDAMDDAGLRAAFDGCGAIVSTVGPFDQFGAPALDAAIAVGAHWTDSSAEQRWVLRAAARDHEVTKAGLTAVPANGCIFAFANAATALLANQLGPLNELDTWLWLDDYDPSRGTARSAIGAADARILHRRGGRLVQADGRAHRVDFPHANTWAAPFAGAEPLLLPKAHPDLHTVRSWLVLSAPEAWGFALGTRMGRVLPARLLQLANRRMEANLSDPDLNRRLQATYTVRVRATGPAGTGSVCIEGNDVYGITGDTLALTAQSLIDEQPQATGVCTVGQALPTEPWLAALSGRGVHHTVEVTNAQADAA